MNEIHAPLILAQQGPPFRNPRASPELAEGEPAVLLDKERENLLIIAHALQQKRELQLPRLRSG
jgi:hypothetical protein